MFSEFQLSRPKFVAAYINSAWLTMPSVSQCDFIWIYANFHLERIDVEQL